MKKIGTPLPVFRVWGYEEYLPDGILVFFSYTETPNIKDGTFRLGWWAEVDGVAHSDVMTVSVERSYLLEKERVECFETLRGSAFRKLDELLKESHIKAGIPQ